MGAHELCKLEVGVRFPAGPPNLFRLDIHGEYARLLTGEGWFNSNRRSQVFVGISPSWSKALVFEISIVGSNPTIPAKFARNGLA